ncbi:PPE family protein [Mycobacterium ulcerans str. Harvey]|uniref:PPE family protein n=1 Tax=Mycobacterium ulcerans str. Harvey TaxID=1299332 RepID=A0ABN0QUY5_MYCUL|nr:PPE family protein [Mycobacterium ulcerans str. Harvey]
MFEAAQAAIVHPAMVAANRNELVALVISNLFGQNAPAIAATEAVYEQLWAQDVAVMAGYHAGVSAIAQQLAPWQQALALPAADADFSLSIFGLQLVKTGTANATTTFGGLAIASGANSSADAGVADIAFAFGSGSSASATGGVLNIAGSAAPIARPARPAESTSAPVRSRLATATRSTPAPSASPISARWPRRSATTR